VNGGTLPGKLADFFSKWATCVAIVATLASSSTKAQTSGAAQMLVNFSGTVDQIDGTNQQPGASLGATITGTVTFATNAFVFVSSNLFTSLYTNGTGSIYYTAGTNVYSYTGIAVYVAHGLLDENDNAFDSFDIQWPANGQSGITLRFPFGTITNRSIGSFLTMAQGGLSQSIPAGNEIILGGVPDGDGYASDSVAEITGFSITATTTIEFGFDLGAKTITLTWPTNGADFQVQSNSTLNDANWTSFTNGTIVSNPPVYSLTIPVGPAAGFFRLSTGGARGNARQP
jgi:hypothetical protein